MTKKPTYEELEERVKALEKRAADYMRTQEALRESEEKYRRLVEHAPTGIYNIDFFKTNLQALMMPWSFSQDTQEKNCFQ